MSLLDRCILKELAAPFTFGVAAFTAILLATNVLFHLVTLMVRHGLPVGLVGEVLALRLPETAFYTFPMSALLATLLAYGRLAGDGEITAFRSLGVGFGRLVAPAAAFALAVALATIALNELVVPHAAWRAKTLLHGAMHQRTLPIVRDHLFYPERDGDGLKRFLYARRFDGRKMEDVVVQEFEAGRLARIIQAAEAEPLQDGWRFMRGVVHQVDARGDFRYTVRFEAQTVSLGADLLALGLEHRSPQEMDARDLAAHMGRLGRAGGSARELAELGVLWHQRFAVPCAAFVFALLGAAMGIRPQRASASTGLGLSILVIFAFYVVMFVSMALGQTGQMPPWLAAWAPNLVTGGLAVWRLRALAQA